MNETDIDEIKLGNEFTITGFRACERSYRQRLISLGLIKGVKVKLTRVAPAGDPLELSVGGTTVSVRRAEAKALKIIKL